MPRMIRMLLPSSALVLAACGGGAGPSQAAITTACTAYRSGPTVSMFTETDLPHSGSIFADGKRYNVDLVTTSGGQGGNGGMLHVPIGDYTVFLDKDLAVGFFDGDTKPVDAAASHGLDGCPELKLAYTVSMPGTLTPGAFASMGFVQTTESAVGIVAQP